MSPSKEPTDNPRARLGDLGALLRWRAHAAPELAAYRFIDPDGDGLVLTAAELHRRAAHLARRLRAVVPPRAPVMLLYPPGPDYVVAFFGSLYAALLPVPAAWPRSAREAERAAAIACEARPAALLTNASCRPRVEQLQRATPSLHHALCLAIDASIAAEHRDAEEERAHAEPSGGDAAIAARPGDIAYLQFTSGSTSAPKGVCVTHANVLHNLRNIEAGFRHTPQSVSVNWLPHFHDMGLVFGLLQPLFSGFQSVQLPAAAFVQQPVSWLRAITRWRATHSGGPNFAYDLCLRRVGDGDRETLDLSHWQVAFCGAEPIRYDTVRDFRRRFAACGFHARAFTPAYGLAEATLKVTGGAAGRPLRTLRRASVGTAPSSGTEPQAYQLPGQTLVGCGPAGLDTTVIVVDPATRRALPDGVIGEIWVRGPGVAAGYWQRPAETAETFGGALSEGVEPVDRQGDQRWLRTGDLGLFRGGELFVTGRAKDVLIVNGRNLFAEDLELAAARGHAAARRAAAAAFAANAGGEERAVLVQELPRESPPSPAALAEAIRTAVATHAGVVLDTIVIVRPGVIPRTSSGKVQRQACRALFADDALAPVLIDRRAPGAIADAAHDGACESAPAPDLPEPSAYVRQQIDQLLTLRLQGGAWDRPLTSLGLDSLKAAELAQRIAVERDMAIDAATLLDGLTPRQLAGLVERARGASAAAPAVSSATGSVAPAMPPAAGPGAAIDAAGTNADGRPSFEQERLWLVDRMAAPGALNLGGWIPIRGELDRERLHAALRRLAERHETLRTAIVEHAGGLVLRVADRVTFAIADLDAGPAAAGKGGLHAALAAEWARPFDLAVAPLVRVAVASVDGKPHGLAVTAHHAICDYRSLQILGGDLAAIDDGLRRGAGITLPPLTLGAREVSARQREMAARGEWSASLDYWREALDGWADREPRRRTPDQRSEREAPPLPDAGRLVLDEAATRSLRELANAHGATPFMVLLAACAAWLHIRSGRDDLAIGCPVAGRPAAAQHAIGLFAYPIPLRLRVPEEATFAALIDHVRAAALGAYRHQDVPFSKIVEVAPRGAAASLARVLCTLVPGEVGTSSATDGTFGPLEPRSATHDVDVSIAWTDEGSCIRGEVTGAARIHGTLPVGESPAGDLGDVVRRCLQSPSAALGPARAAAPVDARPQTTIAIAATFTADPVRESVEFWIERLKLRCGVILAPPGQAIQALLDRHSALGATRAGLNVLLVRLHDWSAALDSTVRQFVEALSAAVDRSPATWLIVMCPDPPGEQFGEAERLIETAFASEPSVTIVNRDEWHRHDTAGALHDPYADRLAQVPYGPAFFAALGTVIARRHAAHVWPRPKVIVLDCDQTLWRGVCGEDGVSGVTMDDAALALQRAVVARQESGMLVALCSKNEARDVWRVFETHPEMPLRRRHVTAARIDWSAKSANLYALAAELDLDPASFVVFDDNPVECAEMRANCPRALVLQVPPADRDIAQWFAHLWPLDASGADRIDVDRARGELYARERERRLAAAAAPSLGAFVAGLDLRITIEAAAAGDLERAAQLTVRTTQMNASPRRFTVAELRQHQRRPGYHLDVVRVSDRFGDYGLAGVIGYAAGVRSLDVDIFLLSCRVLGRGVEERLIAHLGAAAVTDDLPEVRFAVATTIRNQPARDLLARIGARPAAGAAATASAHERRDAGSVRVPASEASALRFDPDARNRAADGASRVVDTAADAHPAGIPPDHALWQAIASELTTPDQVLAAVRAARAARAVPSPLPPAVDAPDSPAARRVAACWAEVLQLDVARVGMDDDFFASGGHSLLALELIGTLRRAFGVELPLSAIFGERLTIAGLVRQIELAAMTQADGDQLERLLREVQDLSDDEVRALLNKVTPA